MKKTLIAGVATVFALSFGIAACGSSDSDDSLSKSELIAQADAICTKGNEALSTKAQAAFGNKQPSNKETVAFISDEIVPLYQGEIDDLRALQPDDADADDWNNIVDTLETELKAVEDDPQAAKDSQNPFPEASAAAKDFGLEVCGS
ncbi:MAG: hypothetical protein J0H98_06225 [Solirubrobacterales bacterium]|nr:hypothetical protein [Solirubrobacterales bacterium]